MKRPQLNQENIWVLYLAFPKLVEQWRLHEEAMMELAKKDMFESIHEKFDNALTSEELTKIVKDFKLKGVKKPYFKQKAKRWE